MRFNLKLNIDKHLNGNLLPLNYQYEQSAVIYKILSIASKEYSTWLHDNGYTQSDIEKKSFKFFTYSRFLNLDFKILKSSERMAIHNNETNWIISFLPEKGTEAFVEGIFSNQSFIIGDKLSRVKFDVINIELLPFPHFSDEMKFQALSPICLKERKGDGSTYYLSPNDEKYSDSLLYSLLSKYKVYYQKEFEDKAFLNLTLLSEPKSALIKIKANTREETKVRGYMYRFKIEAPRELIRLMYEGGMGEQCSQGFGCLDIIE